MQADSSLIASCSTPLVSMAPGVRSRIPPQRHGTVKRFLIGYGLVVFLACPLPSSFAQPTNPDAFHVTIRVDAASSIGVLKPIWRFFGADEPNYIYMPNGRRLLGELGKLSPRNVYFRAHNLLCSGDGTPALKWGSTGVYAEDTDGRPVYNWTILDRIFDTLLENGVRPFVEIGFMPEALSVKPEPYRHSWSPGNRYEEIYTGWAYPPKDYAKWEELVYHWAKHCVERYGKAEVEQWFWEVWNEPNIGYWRGTKEEFFRLHDHAVAGVRRALPTAKVGGPHTAGHGGQFMRDFIEHCLRGTNHATGKIGTPLDFIAFHAKGAPQFVDGHVRMGIAAHLRTIDAGFALIASYPELKGKPVIIGESDPDGCAACPATVYPQNGYRNGPLYASYTAAVFARKQELAARHGINLVGAVTWAFTFEDQPLFAGFRQLATGSIDLPVLNVFRMFSKMGGQQVHAESDGAVPLDQIMRAGVVERPDVGVLASLDCGKLCVLVWHYHDDDLPGPKADVTLRVVGLPDSVTSVLLAHHRIDAEHSNAHGLWQRMGITAKPLPEEIEQLEAAGRLAMLGRPANIAVTNGCTLVRFDLPRQAVSLLVFEW